jgi:hypothetical protein
MSVTPLASCSTQELVTLLVAVSAELKRRNLREGKPKKPVKKLASPSSASSSSLLDRPLPTSREDDEVDDTDEDCYRGESGTATWRLTLRRQLDKELDEMVVERERARKSEMERIWGKEETKESKKLVPTALIE